MAVTYFNSASTPADNSTSTTSPQTITPPLSMVAGDLVLLYAQVRTASVSPVINQAGGQTWSTTTVIGTTYSFRLLWCRFNGTWSANPTVTMGATSGCTLVMHVFRPTTGTNIWEIDVDWATGAFAASTSAITIPSRNTVAASTVTVGSWSTIDDNSWTSLSGSGWVVTGAAQYRNLAGADMSATFAHRIMTTAGATNAVSKTQTVVTNDAGDYTIITFKEVVPSSTSPITGTTAGTSDISATLTGKGTLTGVVAGVNTTSSNLRGKGSLTASTAGTTSLVSELDSVVAGSITGVTSGTSLATATLRGRLQLTGVAGGVANLTGTIKGKGSLTGISAGISTNNGIIRGIGMIIGQSSGLGQLIGTFEAGGLVGFRKFLRGRITIGKHL